MEFVTSLGWSGWIIVAVIIAIALNWRKLRRTPGRVARNDGTLRHYADGRPDQPPGLGGDLQ